MKNFHNKNGVDKKSQTIAAIQNSTEFKANKKKTNSLDKIDKIHWGFNEKPNGYDPNKDKLMVIEPDWALWAFPMVFDGDGNGIINIEISNITDLRILYSSLRLLDISFEMYYPNEDENFIMGFEVEIEGAKENSPRLYEHWKRVDAEAKKWKIFDKALNRFLKATSDKVSFKTFQAYRNLVFHLLNLSELERKSAFWEYLDARYDQDWVEYLQNRNLSQRTIKRYIKARKAFVEWCRKKHITDDWTEYAA